MIPPLAFTLTLPSWSIPTAVSLVVLFLAWRFYVESVDPFTLSHGMTEEEVAYWVIVVLIVVCTWSVYSVWLYWHLAGIVAAAGLHG